MRHNLALTEGDGMSSEWIDWEGGLPPVDCDVKVDAIENTGAIRIAFHASNIDWSKECASKKNYPISKYRIWIPDPRKEWVKIQEGCPMPGEDSSYLYLFVDGEQVIGGCDNDDGWWQWNPNSRYGSLSNPTHWRYPHPDPED